MERCEQLRPCGEAVKGLAQGNVVNGWDAQWFRGEARRCRGACRGVARREIEKYRAMSDVYIKVQRVTSLPAPERPPHAPCAVRGVPCVVRRASCVVRRAWRIRDVGWHAAFIVARAHAGRLLCSRALGNRRPR